MKIIITTGLTGGHLYPACACRDYFREQFPDWEIKLVANDRIHEKEGLKRELEGYDVFYLEDSPFRTRSFFPLLRNFRKSFRYIKEEKPDLVLGFGSNLSFPMIYAAHFSKIPTLIHEQNVLFGKTNRGLIPFTNRVALSFQETYSGKKAVWTGNFIRKKILEKASQPKKIFEREFRLLLIGGSQGSSALNRIMVEVLRKLDKSGIEEIQATLLTGFEEQGQVEEALSGLGMHIVVKPYTDQIEELYAKTDLIISRAGAGTLFEAMSFGIPCIFIPFPHASSHQEENARYLVHKELSFMVWEGANAPEEVRKIILDLYHHRERLLRMSQGMKALTPQNGLQILTETILEMV